MILSKGLWVIRDLARQVWVRVASYSVLALISAGIAPTVAPLLPDGLRDLMGEEPTLDLLSVLTNSMLTVATFSLSVMVVAHQFAASQATPRSHRLLREDGRTQWVLATFIGAFVFALVSRIAINVGVYGPRDFPVIYGATVLVLIAVIVALIRWVQQLAALGSMEKTTGRVEQETRAALEAMAENPNFNCSPLPDEEDLMGHALEASRFGYVAYVDFEKLSKGAGPDGRIDVLVLPGDWVGPGDTVMRIADTSQTEEELLEHIVMGDVRSFDQDPVFGLQVMSEIAQRALSPGLNDPQTAVDVVRRQSRLLDLWTDGAADTPLPGLRVRRTSALRALNVALDHIARDGAAMTEVQMAIQKTLARMKHHESHEMRAAALEVSRRALERSDAALMLQSDRDAVRSAAPAGSARNHSAASR